MVGGARARRAGGECRRRGGADGGCRCRGRMEGVGGRSAPARAQANERACMPARPVPAAARADDEAASQRRLAAWQPQHLHYARQTMLAGPAPPPAEGLASAVAGVAAVSASRASSPRAARPRARRRRLSTVPQPESSIGLLPRPRPPRPPTTIRKPFCRHLRSTQTLSRPPAPAPAPAPELHARTRRLPDTLRRT